MNGTLKALAAATVLAATASLAGAAPVTKLGSVAEKADSSVLEVHGLHQHCARDRYGWHRHNQWGERRRCRTWRGSGPRPDFCVRVGPLWICDY
jgi:hypothetical protein